MYYISDYKKRAIDKIIPYLIEFPQVVKIIENSADRYQAIEDLLWNVANNFKVDDARGIFLDVHAHNEVVDIIYTDKAKDAFTYGTDAPLFQAYGKGHYYSQASYISGSKKDVSEEKMIRAIKAKIIQNNTNGNIEDLLESLKLYFNASNVRLYESNPLSVSLMLVGDKLELSSSGNRDVIKKMLPACIRLGDVFVDTYNFDIFQYNGIASYGDSRYPVLVKDTTDIYTYISLSVNLDSEHKEHIITNHTHFKEGMFACIAGSITEINNNATFISSTDIEDELGFSVNIYNDGEKDVFALVCNNELYLSEVPVEVGKNYTILLYNSGTSLKLWVLNGIQISGKTSNQDLSFISNRVLNSIPNIEVTDYATIEAPIYINCTNTSSGIDNFGDFTYYAIVFGEALSDTNSSKLTEYYVSCYGEKQILFNCFENKNHLYINTINPLISNIMVKQPYYNYKATHSNGKYVYMDGKSGINYYLAESTNLCMISSFNIKFDICMPISINYGNILSDFIGDSENISKIYFNEDNALCITMPVSVIQSLVDDEGNETETVTDTVITYISNNNVIESDEYATFNIIYENNKLIAYKNNEIIMEENLLDTEIYNTPTTLRVAYDKNLTTFYKGFIKNVSLNIIGIEDIEDESEETPNIYNINIDMSYKNKLEDDNKIYNFTNYGARFITTPQLIDDKTNLDIYGNTLMGKR